MFDSTLNSKIRSKPPILGLKFSKNFFMPQRSERRSIKKNYLIEAKLGTSQNRSIEFEAQQKKDKKKFERLRADFQREMESAESTLNEERNKGAKLAKKLSTAETQAQEAISRALVEFRESKEYEDELSMNSIGAYQLRFYDCKKAMA